MRTFLDAINDSNWDEIKLFLATERDGRLGNDLVDTALIKAAQAGQEDVVCLILSLQGHNQPTALGIGRTLCLTARNGDLGLVCSILAAVDKVAFEPWIGEALYEAVSSGQFQIVKTILEYHDSLAIVHIDYALQRAFKTDKWDIVILILALGNLSDSMKSAVIHDAIRKKETELVNLLWDCLFDDLSKDAISDLLNEAAKASEWEFVAELLALEGAKKPSLIAIGTALYLAIDKAHTDTVTSICAMGRSNHRLIPWINHALYQAMSTGKLDLAKVIVGECRGILSSFTLDRVVRAANEKDRSAFFTYLRDNEKDLSAPKPMHEGHHHSFFHRKIDDSSLCVMRLSV